MLALYRIAVRISSMPDVFTNRREKSVKYGTISEARVKMLGGDRSHVPAVDGLSDRVNEGIASQGVCVALDARCTRWQQIDDDAGLTMRYKRRPGAHANRRAAGQVNFL